MRGSAEELRFRVLAWQAAFMLATAALVAPLVPRLLLLTGTLRAQTTRALLFCILVAGVAALLYNGTILLRHRAALRSLGQDSGSVAPHEIVALYEDARNVTTGWLAPQLAGLALLGTGFRPQLLDLTTAVSVALVATVFVAAASLPLHVLVRRDFRRVLERVPPDVMRDAVDSEAKSGEPKRRIPRLLILAVALPVALVALGTALVANAHVRRTDEHERELSARVLAAAALGQLPGESTPAGQEAAIRQADRLGFAASTGLPADRYRVERDQDGIVNVFTPLDEGGARISFTGSTVGVFSPASLVLALLAVAIAAYLGSLLGRALGNDLEIATRGVKLLGTEAVLSGGTRVMRRTRFRLVEELGLAIEGLAERFRVFARAQERAIAARERAVRMRGLFFASVSHDLKSPLNAILGFTELVRHSEPVSEGQAESLGLIERRGRELLALIETILDAARVEAGQLRLLEEPVTVSDLFGDALAIGRDLGGSPKTEVVAEILEGIPTLQIDRLRVGRALATLIAHALRSAERDFVRMRAAPSRAGGARIDIEVPSTRISARQLLAMLDPSRDLGHGQHRGLALGLGLSRAIFELHGGSVIVTDRGSKGSVFTVRIPVREPAESS